jgi:transcriptional regulator with XRE-family HTH domain
MAKRRASVNERDRPTVYFREWREYRGMSQTQVQDELGWSKGQLSRLETGAQGWTPTTLGILARVYACEPGDLFKPPPVHRSAFDLAALGPGFAEIGEMHELIGRLKTQITELRGVMSPRLETLETDLRNVGVISEKAIRNAAELAELFARYAATPPEKKTPETPSNGTPNDLKG